MTDKNNIFRGFEARKRKYRITVSLLALILIVLACISMTLGSNACYSLKQVAAVLGGEDIQGATYIIKTLRFPRTLAALLCGFAFGVAGNTFQTMLGNPLASPDIIGVTSGASVAAVFGILILQVNRGICSIMALFAGLLAAALIYLIAYKGYYSNAKLILTGIGAQAFFNALISWMLLVASQYDVPTAMRWLSGNFNGVTIDNIPRLAISVILATGLLLFLSGPTKALELGDAYATVLGLKVNVTRILLIVCSVVLISSATSVSGPVSSIAFLSGPIAGRICKKGHSNILSSGFIGAIITMTADFIGNNLLPTRYPVGVITGILGAPYLLYLLIKTNRGERV